MPRSSPPRDQEVLLDGLSILARLYWGPDQELCEDLASPAGRDLFTRLARLLPAAAPTLRSIQFLLQAAESPESLCDELQPAYAAAYQDNEAEAPAPLHHSRYVGKGRFMGPPAAAMAERLEQAGLSLGDKSGQPPDHLAVELEYLIFLLEEDLAGRRSQGSTEAGDLARRFMLPWVREFARRQDLAASPLLPLAAKLLVALLEEVDARAVREETRLRRPA